MRILFIGDVIGRPGRVVVQRTVPGKSYADGWAIAWLVDTTGQAVAAVCPKEPAVGDFRQPAGAPRLRERETVSA